MNTKRLHSPRLVRLLCCSSLAFATVLAGCGAGMSVPATVPVKGVVKYKGKPARGVRVMFHPQGGAPIKSFVPIGDTGPDGSFTLSTGAPLNGAPLGAYLVTFERPILDPAKSVETEIDGFKGKYSDPAQSKWTVTIASGENSLKPFELE